MRGGASFSPTQISQRCWHWFIRFHTPFVVINWCGDIDNRRDPKRLRHSAGHRYCCICFTQLHTGVYSEFTNCALPGENDIWFDLSVCLTSHATIFQLYMWRHIDVQTEWRRSLTYGRAPIARHFVGFFNVPVQALTVTRGPPFLYGYS